MFIDMILSITEKPQNDGISSSLGNQQQSNYGAHQLSYFDQDIARSQPHASVAAVSDQAKIDSQSHPIQSSEGSPPPVSAPTSSSSTSGSGSTRISDQPQGLNSSQYSVSVSEGMITKPYDDSDLSQTPTSHIETAVDVPISHTQEGKSNPASYQSAIKLMVSNNVAGSIIGRAGQTISDLQNQSSARIKLSQTGDYYPGTQDRVCLVQGQLGTVKHAVKLLLERFYMLQEQQHTQHSWQPRKSSNSTTGFDFVVRLLVPSSSCGMIIGKGGANIKHMEETSGVASVRLSPKEGPDQAAHPTSSIATGTQERVVTLTGPTLESCVNCIFIVIDCMFANHEICRYTNMTTSYSRHVAPGSYTPVQPGRPLHLVPSAIGEWENQGPYGSFTVKRSSSQPELAHVPVEQQRREQSRIPTDSFGGNIAQQDIGQRDPPVQQFNPAFIDTPQAYNADITPMIGQDRGQRSNTQTAPMYLLGASAQNQLDHPQMQNSSSAPDLLAMDNLRISNSQSSQVDYNHFAHELPQLTRSGFTAQVLIPDNLIGSILGRGGSTLNELQLHSNTRIRISQRGEYVPGTRNRIVTIRGQTAHSVSLAQYLMSQRMVLPPTAGFSGQSTQIAASYVHPSQIQQSHAQRLPIHPHSHTGPVSSPATAPQQQAMHEAAFLPSESNPSTTGAPPLSLTLNHGAE